MKTQLIIAVIHTTYVVLKLKPEECKRIYKMISLNYGERYEDTIDHRSDTDNLSTCKIKA